MSHLRHAHSRANDAPSPLSLHPPFALSHLTHIRIFLFLILHRFYDCPSIIPRFSSVFAVNVGDGR